MEKASLGKIGTSLRALLLSFHCISATECSMSSYKFVHMLNNALIGGSKNLVFYDD